MERSPDTAGNGMPRLAEPSGVVAHVYVGDPESPAGERFETFVVPRVKFMTVNDVLEYITEEIGADIAYRRYCGVKKCGTCGVRVNGREVLACWTPAQPDMTIEPLRNAPHVRDLVVDRGEFESAVQRVHPLVERDEPYAGFPEPLAHNEMGSAAALGCLSCMACTSACPEVGNGSDFAGPAVLVALAQSALDPRDGRDRADTVRDMRIPGSCSSCGICETVCPAGIPIVSGVIEPLGDIAAGR